MNRLSNAVDVHQHLWPEELVRALRARSEPPCLRGWTLRLAGEPPFQVDPGDHEIGARAAQARDDGVGLVLLSLSSPLGIESLPAAHALPLLDAYHEGVLGLPPPFSPGWAAACLDSIDAGSIERLLGRGFAGLQLPATAVCDGAGYRVVAPLLEMLERCDRPLFIHPGPARAVDGAPAWWAAMVDYVHQMHAAWFAWQAHGRPSYPRLRVCFAMLAGLAPLHGERFAARARVARAPVDHGVYLDVSSYGTRAIDATVRVLGIDALVSGSDRPYAMPVTPDLGAAGVHAIRCSNPLRLLDSQEVTHVRACA